MGMRSRGESWRSRSAKGDKAALPCATTAGEVKVIELLLTESVSVDDEIWDLAIFQENSPCTLFWSTDIRMWSNGIF